MENSTNKLVLSEISEGILTITINRADKLNALNFNTLQELEVIVKELYTNNDIKGVIITGAGTKAFVAGADISEFSVLNFSSGQAASEKGQLIFDLIENSKKPVLAAINGFALGGGCELALACHIRIASENAIMGQPEINLGIIPGYGGTSRLPKIVGKAKALEWMLTGNSISSAEALQTGLVNHVVAQQELMRFTRTLLLKIISKSHLSIEKIIESVYTNDVNQAKIESASFGMCCESDNFKEGVNAFMEKRKPNFN
jgi:enoyl-CoA hydratase